MMSVRNNQVNGFIGGAITGKPIEYFMELSREREDWLPVKGFEDQMRVSSFGRYETFTRQVGYYKGGKKPMIWKGKVHTPKPTGEEYPQVRLYSQSGVIYKNIHILVAEHFIPNPENKSTVNHDDGNKRNNNWWNLEWNTYDENNKHAKRTGLNKTIGETHHWATITNVQVLEIMSMNLPYEEIANMYGITPTAISCIKTGRTWGHITGIEHKNKPKLKPHQVVEIYKSSLPRKELAKIYNVTKEAIGYIKQGNSYYELTKNVKKST